VGRKFMEEESKPPVSLLKFVGCSSSSSSFLYLGEHVVGITADEHGLVLLEHVVVIQIPGDGVVRDGTLVVGHLGGK